jgi:hypothetical protein
MEESFLVNVILPNGRRSTNTYRWSNNTHNCKLMIKLILSLSRGSSEFNRCSVSGPETVISLAFRS